MIATRPQLIVKTLILYGASSLMYTSFAWSTGNSGLVANWVGTGLNGTPCTGRGQGYGPWDYTNSQHRREKLPIVTGAHFTKEVESLKKGKSGSIGEDLDYTLRAFPNHHRALYAMMRYQLKSKNGYIPNDVYSSAECYFQRAIKFKPDDYRTMQLYANYLIKKNHPEMAISVYKRALTVDGAPVDVNYALGLLYVDLKEYDLAVEQARIAYGAGLKKTKLARKLKKINRWPLK